MKKIFKGFYTTLPITALLSTVACAQGLRIDEMGAQSISAPSFSSAASSSVQEEQRVHVLDVSEHPSRSTYPGADEHRESALEPKCKCADHEDLAREQRLLEGHEYAKKGDHFSAAYLFRKAGREDLAKAQDLLRCHAYAQKGDRFIAANLFREAGHEDLAREQYLLEAHELAKQGKPGYAANLFIELGIEELAREQYLLEAHELAKQGKYGWAAESFRRAGREDLAREQEELARRNK